MIKTILVPVDGSAHANTAVDTAGEMAAKMGAKIILLNVIARPGSSRVPEELRGYAQLEHVRVTEQDLLQAAANDIVAKAEKRARAKGATKVESTTRIGDPARTIVAMAKDRDVDLITMGRRGLGGLKGLLLGSVSHKVSQLADRPCMTVS
jgi:nucleotide-binding universal stress UspA family protein